MGKLISIEKLTLKDMINNPVYSSLAEGLREFPLPQELTIGKKRYSIPDTLGAFTESLCYGQRLFIVQKEDNDYGSILRLVDCYYYPLVEKSKWDEEKALLFGKLVLTCKVKDLYPVAMHLISLVAAMITREQKLLHREPTPIEKAAGIEKLNKFAELNSLDFLCETLRCTVKEVMLTPYNECLVRFIQAKETVEYQNRYFELQTKPDKK